MNVVMGSYKVATKIVNYFYFHKRYMLLGKILVKTKKLMITFLKLGTLLVASFK
jgi:hypothetical protein